MSRSSLSQVPTEKTTTTSLVAALLKDAGKDVACVGNIGKSWARDLAERDQPAAYQVVEVSSFQLDGVTSFRPNIAILLNITPDHLDRYADDIDRYANAKWRITAHQTKEDVLVINAEDDLSMERWKSSAKNHGTQARVVAVSTRKKPQCPAKKPSQTRIASLGRRRSRPEQTTRTIHDSHTSTKTIYHDHPRTGIAGKTQPVQQHGRKRSGTCTRPS